jgi:hypothetical protein
MELEVIGMLSDHMVVTTSYEYFQKEGSFGDFDWDDGTLSDDQESECEAIQNILSADIAIFLTRRTSGMCGSVVDNLRSIYNNFVNEYQEKFNKKYIDFNKEVDY